MEKKVELGKENQNENENAWGENSTDREISRNFKNVHIIPLFLFYYIIANEKLSKA